MTALAFVVVVTDGATMRTLHPAGLGVARAAQIERVVRDHLFGNEVPVPRPVAPLPPDPPGASLMSQREIAAAQGFTGDACATCGGFRAVTAFGMIAAGTLGGWIEREANLSQVSGDAWVSGNAWVYGDAQVYGDAWVYGNARVSRPITCATRSDRYTFTLATDRAGHPVVIAGCRYFTFEQAREHWQATRSGTPLGEETFAILDMLERISAVRGPEPGCAEEPAASLADEAA